MGASHTIKLGQANGQDIARGTEATTAAVEEFVLVTDPDDRLYCPGVDDEPTSALIQSIRNGWQKGETLKCVNRGKKGGALVLVVADGRSRLKATRKVNEERERDGLALIRPEFVLLTEDEAYEVMHTSHNKQERKPSFDARCWGQYKRIQAKSLGKASLDDYELREVRRAYADLRKCSLGQVKAWEAILSAHPELLQMFDDRAPGISRAAVLDIVASTEFAKQPEAARKIVAMAKAKKEEPTTQGEAQVTHYAGDNCTPAHAEQQAQPSEPEARPARGTRSERTDRRAALGIETTHPIAAKKLAELAVELRKLDEPDLVDPRVFLALILGETEFDGLPIDVHPSMKEVVQMSKRVGIKVAK
jgi:hypothetical protein